MARYKPYDYSQMLMVPVSLENQLMAGTLEFAIHHLVEERVDTRIFDERYRNDATGRVAFDPKVLLKIVLFGYSRGMMSSRKLERACHENVTFMALACGQRPDHSTLAAFVSSMGEERIVSLFTQVLLICEQEGLLGGTHFSLDGLRLSSNASKECSGTHTELQKKQEKLTQKVQAAVREHREADQGKGDPDRERRERQIDRLKRQADRIENFLAHNKPKHGGRGQEIQSNVTDPESAKMVSSHGVVQGYNANACVDSKHQVVVHAQAFGNGDDASNVGPMLEGTQRNLEAAGAGTLDEKIFTADTGYFSMANLESCREHNVDAYIPDRLFRQRDPRFAEAQRHRRSVDKKKKRHESKKRWFDPTDFKLDERSGKLICPAGAELYIKKRNFLVGGYRFTAYQGRQGDCGACHLRSKCLRNPQSPVRQVHVLCEKPTGKLTDAMKAKIDTPQGRATYAKRLAIVEPVFGNIRAQKRLDRFTLRGRLKVNIQWMLYCLVHNIEKILNFGPTYAAAT